ncbi:MAG: LysM peptidoglycan-binding domain-containing protein [Actinomycetota bacterium]|nr:LysM peptidoglycan-binding domain-containing protein [Actinomycetota bacterium]|tara:strand:- start:542 stop:982 length:441 start_codon:yes stop_codon:yes gene_type:complete
MQNTLNFNPKLEESYNNRLPFIVDSPNTVYPVDPPRDFPYNRSNSVKPRKYRYGIRRVVAGTILSIIGALVWTILAHVAGLNNDIVGADISPNAPQEIYVVQSGDTLWSIAMTFDADGDPRDTIDRLAELNGGSNLYIGQRLILSN